ncbi:MAG: hypothetical protein P9X24_16170 [Candidatus Hatepunaea meridiana]|nr:hypothetical protein [Candidatus Hatepunaea meridiana]
MLIIKTVCEIILAMTSVLAFIVAICAINQSNKLIKITNDSVLEMEKANQFSIIPYINMSKSLDPLINVFNINSDELYTEIRFAYEVNIIGNAPVFQYNSKTVILDTTIIDTNTIIENPTLYNDFVPGHPFEIKLSVKLYLKGYTLNQIKEIKGNNPNFRLPILKSNTGDVIHFNVPFYFGVICVYSDVFDNKYKYHVVYEIKIYENSEISTRILNSDIIFDKHKHLSSPPPPNELINKWKQ